MADKIYSLNVPHGIKRDGTNFETGEFTEGQWTRFQRGRPRKAGGYRLMSANPFTNQIPRGMVSQSKDGNTYSFAGSKAGLTVYINSNDNGIGQGPFVCNIGNEIFAVAVRSATASNTLTFVGDQTPSGSNIFTGGQQIQIWNSTTKSYSTYTLGAAGSSVYYTPSNNTTTIVTTTVPSPTFTTVTPAIVTVSKSSRYNSSTLDQYTWNFGINYSPNGGAYSVIAHGPRNLINIDSTEQTQVYVGNIVPNYGGAWISSGVTFTAAATNTSKLLFNGDQTGFFTPLLNISTTATGAINTTYTVLSSSASLGLASTLTVGAGIGDSVLSVIGDQTALFPIGTNLSIGSNNYGVTAIYVSTTTPVYANGSTSFGINRELVQTYPAGTNVYNLTTTVTLTAPITAAAGIPAGTNIFSFDTAGATPSWTFTALADTTGQNPTGAPIKTDGGVCVLYPFVFVYGSNGFIANNHVASYAPSSTTTTSYVQAGTVSGNIAANATTMSVSGSAITTFPAGTVISFTSAGTTTYSVVGTPVYDGTKTTFSVTPAIVTAVTSGAIVYKQTVTTVSTGTYLQNSFTDWNGPTANQVNLAAGKILKGLPVRGGTNSPSGLFWATNALIRVSFTGSAPLYWSNDIISTDCTCISGSAVVQQDSVYYWMGTDRFYLYNGTVQVLPNEKNLNWVYDNLNYTYRSKVWGVSVPKFNEIWWFYPRGLSTECNAVVIYNTKDNIWYDLGEADGCRRSCGVAPGIFPYPIFAGHDYTPVFGTVFDNATTVTTNSVTIPGNQTQNVPGTFLTIINPNLSATEKANSTTVFQIATCVYTPLDPVTLLGDYTVFTFTQNFTVLPTVPGNLLVYQTIGGYPLWQHDFNKDKVFYTDITAIKSYIETSDIGFLNGDPSTDTNAVGLNRRMKMFRLEPDFVQNGQMTLQIYGRAYPSDSDTIDGYYTFDPDTQKIDFHEEFRILRLRFGSNEVGGDFQMGRCLVICEPGDERA